MHPDTYVRSLQRSIFVFGITQKSWEQQRIRQEVALRFGVGKLWFLGSDRPGIGLSSWFRIPWHHGK